MLRMENISKSFKTVKALQNIDFEVNEGELFGLVGPDGAGKKTLFSILVTITHPDEGQAFVGGFDVGKDYRKIKGIFFALFSSLSCCKNTIKSSIP